MLAICSQDIQDISFFLSSDHGGTEKRYTDTPPEAHLQALDAFLQEQGVALSSVSAVLVVTGPGSFTASRVSTTLANALAFSQHIPILGIENPERKPLSEIVAEAFSQPFPPIGHFAVPSYDRPANITVPKPSV